MKKQARKIYLKPEFVMTKEELQALDQLPPNMPETKLTQKQKDLISQLYRKYLSKIDNRDWSTSLVDMEKSEKWPSGPRMKHHEAQRICLGFLVGEQHLNGMSTRRAMEHFYFSMSHRAAAVKLTQAVWDVDRTA